MHQLHILPTSPPTRDKTRRVQQESQYSLSLKPTKCRRSPAYIYYSSDLNPRQYENYTHVPWEPHINLDPRISCIQPLMLKQRRWLKEDPVFPIIQLATSESHQEPEKAPFSPVRYCLNRYRADQSTKFGTVIPQHVLSDFRRGAII